MARQAAQAREREERQRHGGARRHDLDDVALIEDAPRGGDVADDVAQIARLGGRDEQDLLTGEQRSALRRIEGHPERTAERGDARRQARELHEVPAGGRDEQGARLLLANGGERRMASGRGNRRCVGRRGRRPLSAGVIAASSADA